MPNPFKVNDLLRWNSKYGNDGKYKSIYKVISVGHSGNMTVIDIKMV